MNGTEYLKWVVCPREKNTKGHEHCGQDSREQQTKRVHRAQPGREDRKMTQRQERGTRCLPRQQRSISGGTGNSVKWATTWRCRQEMGHFFFCLFQKCPGPPSTKLPPEHTLPALPADIVFSEIGNPWESNLRIRERGQVHANTS